MTKVKISGIKVYRSKGKLYAYHRATGTPLVSPVGTPEFFAELAAIDAKPSKVKETPGTWGGLVFHYKSSPHFENELKPRTRRDYNLVFKWLAGLSDMPLIKITRPFIHDLRDKAYVQKKRRFANYVLAVISEVFSYGIEHGLAHENPVSRVKKIRRPKDLPRANWPWTNEEWQAVTEAASKHILAPIMLGGLLGWHEGEFPHNATTLLVSSTGRPWTQDGFRKSFFRLIQKLEAKGQVGPDLTFHGLRHFRATRLREAGFDKQTIADFRQETTSMAGYYS